MLIVCKLRSTSNYIDNDKYIETSGVDNITYKGSTVYKLTVIPDYIVKLH